MIIATIALLATAVGRQILEMRSSWSPLERQRRAKMAQQRQRELIALLVAPDHASEVWAVGAPTVSDLRRISG